MAAGANSSLVIILIAGCYLFSQCGRAARALAFFILCIFGLAAAWCISDAPLSGRSRFLMHDSAHISDVGDTMQEALTRHVFGKVLPLTDARTLRVRSIGAELSAMFPPRFDSRTWDDALQPNNHSAAAAYRFYVVTAESVNAFAAADGSVVVHTGMLQFIDKLFSSSEKQDSTASSGAPKPLSALPLSLGRSRADSALALVLAHELAHIHAEHMLEAQTWLELVRYVPKMLSQRRISFEGGIATVDLEGLTKKLLSCSMSRDMELEADYISTQVATRACFDATTGPALWKAMAGASDAQSEYSWLSTHPSSASREQAFQAWLSESHLRVDQHGFCDTPALVQHVYRDEATAASELKHLNSLSAHDQRRKLSGLRALRGQGASYWTPRVEVLRARMESSRLLLQLLFVLFCMLQFQRALLEALERVTAHVCAAALSMLDTNGDGHVSFSEVRAVVPEELCTTAQLMSLYNWLGLQSDGKGITPAQAGARLGAWVGDGLTLGLFNLSGKNTVQVRPASDKKHYS
jgi:hypothetical protein